MHRGHPIGSMHFPRLTGHFFLPFAAVFRTLLSAPRQRLSPAPSPPRLSAARNPAPATASLPPFLRRRLESQGHRRKNRGCFCYKWSLLPHTPSRNMGEGGGVSFFLSFSESWHHNPARIYAHCALQSTAMAFY